MHCFIFDSFFSFFLLHCDLKLSQPSINLCLTSALKKLYRYLQNHIISWTTAATLLTFFSQWKISICSNNLFATYLFWDQYLKCCVNTNHLWPAGLYDFSVILPDETCSFCLDFGWRYLIHKERNIRDCLCGSAMQRLNGRIQWLFFCSLFFSFTL